jgi:hypothetical protein
VNYYFFNCKIEPIKTKCPKLFFPIHRPFACGWALCHFIVCNSLVILLWLMLPRDHFVSRYFLLYPATFKYIPYLKLPLLRCIIVYECTYKHTFDLETNQFCHSSVDGNLTPLKTDLPPALETLLKLIQCNCNQIATQSLVCTCRKTQIKMLFRMRCISWWQMFISWH